MRGDGWNRNCVIEFVCLSRLSLSESWLRLSRSGIRSGLTARPRWSRRGWKSGTVLCVQYFARKQHFLLSGFWKYQGQKGDSTADFPRDSAPSFSLARQLDNLLHERIGTSRIPNFLLFNSRHHPLSPDSSRTLVSQRGIYTARTEGTRGPTPGCPAEKKKGELTLMMAMPHALLVPRFHVEFGERRGVPPKSTPLHHTPPFGGWASRGSLAVAL